MGRSGATSAAGDGGDGAGGRVHDVGTDRPLGAGVREPVELAEACDVPVAWSCPTGVCHTCECELVDGELAYLPHPLDAPEEGRAGLLQPASLGRGAGALVTMSRTPEIAGTRLLLLTGSTRHLSTNSAALRTAQELLNGQVTKVYERLGQLPSFNPDDDHGTPPPAVQALRFLIAEADALIFCTPEYAGSLPGSFKNLLDWTVGGGEIYGKPAAWINVAAPGRGGGADAALRLVLGYVGATILESSGLRVPISHDSVRPDGLIGDPATRASLGEALANILMDVDAVASGEA